MGGDCRLNEQRVLGDAIDGKSGGGGGDSAGGLPQSSREDAGCVPRPAVPEALPDLDSGCPPWRSPSPQQEDGSQSHRGPCMQNAGALAELSDSVGTVGGSRQVSVGTVGGSRRVTWLCP